MSIIDRFLQLNLPNDQCVVIGSGILDALGLRESRDVDIVAHPELFNALEASGQWHVSVVDGNTKLEKNDVEIWRSWGNGELSSFFELYERSVVIQDVHFANPEFVVAWKRQRGRAKDLNDVKLLEGYLHHE